MDPYLSGYSLDLQYLQVLLISPVRLAGGSTIVLNLAIIISKYLA
eukprot:SAG31_NODE_11091_length_1061_cov_14.009307_2_plen_44_part_01